MPCRSSRASISFRPREIASARGGRSAPAAAACGLGGGDNSRRRRSRWRRNGPWQRHRLSASGARPGLSPVRGRLRSGLTCFATLSHSARSSSLRLRLRRGGIVFRGSSSTSGVSSRWRKRRCDVADRFGSRLDFGPGRRQRHRLYHGGLRGWLGTAPRCCWPRHPSETAPQIALDASLGFAILQRIDLRKQFCDFLRRPRVRHRHLAAARGTGSRLFGSSMTKRILWRKPARHPARFRPGAEIEIGARRTDDRRPRILRDHQPAKRRFGCFGFDRQLALDEERRAVDMQRLVDRDRAARRQRHALRADRLVRCRRGSPRGRTRRNGSAAATRWRRRGSALIHSRIFCIDI